MNLPVRLEPPLLIFPDQTGGFFVFQAPVSIHPGEALAVAEQEARSRGGWLAGGLQYHDQQGLSRGWWGVFDSPQVWSSNQLMGEADASEVRVGPLTSSWDFSEYERAFQNVRHALKEGTTYQVNLTFGLHGRATSGSPWSWRSALRLWLELLPGQGREGALAVFGTPEKIETVLVSLSPELFFRHEGSWIETRPMKGTAVRDPDPAIDEAHRAQLQNSDKTRAENLMITDMLRNDLGRIALPGQVTVPQLFQIEAYPSVWQMTSTVRARLPESTPLTPILEALFPCASITGAPKVSTQQIIARTELSPRSWYTGTLGWHRCASSLHGESRGRFSVLIRTLEFTNSAPDFRLGVGGGVVWDSSAASEWDEAWAKARFLRPVAREFHLTEAILWEPDNGYFLLEEHVARLGAACQDFGGRLDVEALLRALDRTVAAQSSAAPPRPLKIRVLIDPAFQVQVEAEVLSPMPEILTVALAAGPLSPPSLLWRRYKTTARTVYDSARIPGIDQTLYYNERGELTESTSMNVVLEIGGRLVTPALSCGLLGGTFRAHLLREKQIEEAIIPVEKVNEADKIWLINSVRRWKSARLSPIISSQEGSL